MAKRTPKTIEEWIRDIQPQINQCRDCQPFDEGNPVWISGSPTSVSDLLDAAGVPKTKRAQVAAGLVCDLCGRRLEVDSEVSLKTRSVRIREEWEQKWKPMLREFTRWMDRNLG